MTPKTGWPPGMLQDDDSRLSRWFASRPGGRYQVRKNIMEITDKQPHALRLAEGPHYCLDCKGTGADQEKTRKARQTGACDSRAYVRCWTCNGNGLDPAKEGRNV